MSVIDVSPLQQLTRRFSAGRGLDLSTSSIDRGELESVIAYHVIYSLLSLYSVVGIVHLRHVPSVRNRSAAADHDAPAPLRRLCMPSDPFGSCGLTATPAAVPIPYPASRRGEVGLCPGPVDPPDLPEARFPKYVSACLAKPVVPLLLLGCGADVTMPKPDCSGLLRGYTSRRCEYASPPP